MLMFTTLRKRYWEYRHTHSVSMHAPTEQKIRYYVNWYYYTHNVVMPTGVIVLLNLVCDSVACNELPADYAEITDECELIDEICWREFDIPKNWNDEY